MSLLKIAATSAMVVACHAAGAFAQSAYAPSSKTFKDWEVGCDNLRGCVAMGFLRDESANGYIRVSLAGGPNAKPEIKLIIDGDEIADMRVLTPDGAGRGFAALIAAARKHDRATLSDAKGGKKAEFSLAGAAAALLFIDDAQGRVGTTTALVRSGPKPASAVPPALKEPAIKAVATAAFGAADPKLKGALLKALPQSVRDECDRMTDKPDGDIGEAFAMGGGLTFVMLPCDAGAYNFNSVAWLVKGSDVANAQSVQFAEPDGKPSEGLTNADYDPATGELSFFNKGRGVGDCGVAGSYVWTGRGFALASYRKMGRCQGAELDVWPSIWRTTIAK